MTENEKTIALMAAILYGGGVRASAEASMLPDATYCVTIARKLVNAVEQTRPKDAASSIPLAVPIAGGLKPDPFAER